MPSLHSVIILYYIVLQTLIYSQNSEDSGHCNKQCAIKYCIFYSGTGQPQPLKLRNRICQWS